MSCANCSENWSILEKNLIESLDLFNRLYSARDSSNAPTDNELLNAYNTLSYHLCCFQTKVTNSNSKSFQTGNGDTKLIQEAQNRLDTYMKDVGWHHRGGGGGGGRNYNPPPFDVSYYYFQLFLVLLLITIAIFILFFLGRTKK